MEVVCVGLGRGGAHSPNPRSKTPANKDSLCLVPTLPHPPGRCLALGKCLWNRWTIPLGAPSPSPVKCSAWTRSPLRLWFWDPIQLTSQHDQTPSSQLGHNHWKAQDTVWWSPTLCSQPYLHLSFLYLQLTVNHFHIPVPAFTWIEFNLHIAMLWLSVAAQSGWAPTLDFKGERD